MAETAFQANAFQNDAFQIVGGQLPNNDRGDYPALREPAPRRKSRRENERPLDIALAKAFEEKRRPVQKHVPWLAEPIAPPPLIDAPEFNPTLAALHGEMANLQAQLARIQFNRAQEEADDELLLLAL